MKDKRLKSATWQVGQITVKLTLDETFSGVRIVNVMRYSTSSGAPFGGDPSYYGLDENGKSDKRFADLLAELTAKHGEPDERTEG